jgi:hypothetical protein
MNTKIATLKKFLEGEEPAGREGGSKLDPYASQLIDLRRQGYSFRQIEQAIGQAGIKASPSEIHRYLKKRETK